MKRNQKGFTLIELLAVIVILAIILVIAVPQIMDTIDSARKASLESSVKMVAAAAENQYTVAQTLGTSFATGSATEKVACGSWAGIATDTAGEAGDYAACEYWIENGIAYVTLTGSANGKFSKFTGGCTGTRAEITSCNPSE